MVRDISTTEFKVLYNQVLTMLGYPVREVEISPEVLQTLLDVSIEEYSSRINDWLIQQQWGSLQGLPISTTDIAFALTTKTLDFEKSFTYAYSKQTGISSNGPWELKKDFFVVSACTQDYPIEKGREIINVLWRIPPQLTSTYGTIESSLPLSFGNGVGSFGGGGLPGNEAIAILPAFSMYQSTADIKMKKLMLQSDLTYTISKKRTGESIIHLYPVPGSSDEIRGFQDRHYEGSHVWYWYYDLEGATEDEKAACLEANDDIMHTPNDVQLKNIPYQKLNSSSKTRVRRLVISEAKNYLALDRGKFSGVLTPRASEKLTMDYAMLAEQAKAEKDAVYADLDAYLDKMTYRKLMEDREAIANSLNSILQKTVPLQGLFMI